MCVEPRWSSGRQRSKRKNWECTSVTDTPDPADVTHRPAKRLQRANPGAPPEVLWNRWRQMEPRGGGEPDAGGREQRNTIDPRLNKNFQSESTESEADCGGRRGS